VSQANEHDFRIQRGSSRTSVGDTIQIEAPPFILNCDDSTPVAGSSEGSDGGHADFFPLGMVSMIEIIATPTISRLKPSATMAAWRTARLSCRP